MKRRALAVLTLLAVAVTVALVVATAGESGLPDPPDTFITDQPSDPSSSTSASFSFTSSEGGSTFECNLDGLGFSSCPSPQPYSDLSAGGHTFEVRAIDSALQPDPTPAPYSWTIEPPANTPPVVDVSGASPVEASSPTGGVISWSVTVTDAEDDPEPGVDSCTGPASGSTQPLGSYEISCSSLPDSGGLTGSSDPPLTIVVRDTTPPAVTTDGNITQEATSSSGAVVTYSASALDAVDGPVPVSCVPLASGLLFPLGPTTITCTASDTASPPNTGSASPFIVAVVDTIAPDLSGLPNQILEATGPAGAVATYSLTAPDLVDGSVPVTCAPVSPHTFPIGGPYIVNCSATDVAGNLGEGSFTVTVVNADPDDPEFSPPPPNVTAEANGATGAVVFYGPISASDPQDGAIIATCTPASGTTFAIAVTPVNCTATDIHGNSSPAGFTITVQDTTAPILILPGNPIILSEGPVSSTSVVISSFLSFASAIDLVDTSVPVTNNAPSSYPVGSTPVTFTAKDDAGNTATATRFVNVVATAVPGAVLPTQPIPPSIQPDAPPGNVRAVAAKLLHRSIQLAWTNPADPDFDRVEIMRSPGKRGADQTLVYRGAAPKFRDDNLASGKEYRYLLVTVDKKGNRAVGVAIVVVARVQLLLAPKDGATVGLPPLLKWEKVARTTYYNVQLYFLRGLRSAAKAEAKIGAKIGSFWPKTPSLKLKAKFRYNGGQKTLKPGCYGWYVWPGYGDLADVNYGKLLGQSEFCYKPKKPKQS